MALPLLQGAHELGGLAEQLRRACIEPRIAPAEALHVQLAHPEIGGIHVGDFQFATRRGLESRGDLHHARVVEVEPGDRPARLRQRRFLLDGERATPAIQLDDPVPLRVGDGTGEDGGASLARRGARENLNQPVTEMMLSPSTSAELPPATKSAAIR